MASMEEVLEQLRLVVDEGLQVDIVKLGFVKDLKVDEELGLVVFRLEVEAYVDRAKAARKINIKIMISYYIVIIVIIVIISNSKRPRSRSSPG